MPPTSRGTLISTPKATKAAPAMEMKHAEKRQRSSDQLEQPRERRAAQGGEHRERTDAFDRPEGAGRAQDHHAEDDPRGDQREAADEQHGHAGLREDDAERPERRA